jgi:hypothetical protein
MEMFPNSAKTNHQTIFGKTVGPTRFERVTSRLSAVRSTWLSYGPGPHFALLIPLITVSLASRAVGLSLNVKGGGCAFSVCLSDRGKINPQLARQ